MPQDLNANNSKVPPSDIADPNQSFSEIPEDFRQERITVWGEIVSVMNYSRKIYGHV